MPTKAQLDARLKKNSSGTYVARFRGKDGRSHTRSTGAKTLEEARRILEESRLLDIEAAAKANALNAESLTAIMAGRKVTCATAVAEWAEWRAASTSPNTLRTQLITLNQWMAKISAGGWPVNKLKFEHIDGFVNDKADDAGRSTRDSRLASIRSFFEFITARAYYAGNPSKLVSVRLRDLSHEQKEHKERVPFTEREFNHIMQHTEGKWRWWAALSYWAGLRLADCACLEWASVLENEIVVWTKKSDARVALPIDDPLIGGGKLRTIMLEIMEVSHHPLYVFPDDREVAMDPSKRARHSVYFGRVLEELGIEGKSFHCLRHSFATRLAKAGKSVEDIGRLLGHSKSSSAGSVTAGYIHT